MWLLAVTYSTLFEQTIALLGIAIFASVFSLTFAVPEWLESVASTYIERELSERLDTTIDRFSPPTREGLIGDLGRKLFEANEEKIADAKQQLRTKAHEAMALALAEIRNLDCECRSKYAAFFQQGFEFNISILQSANDKIVQTIQGGYMKMVGELKRDIRIFSLTNLAVFVLLLFASLLRPTAKIHLLVPTMLLVTSTLICSYFYVFQQDWLLTIVFSDYVGFGYLAYLGIVTVFLGDIIYNQGLMTTALLNRTLESIGSALTVPAC